MCDLPNKKNKCFFQDDTPFIDDQFPPTDRSVGDLKKNIPPWLRIRDVVCREKNEKTEWTVMLNPQPNDIEQGHLGDCWLMAALTLITQRPRMLSHILLTSTVNKQGIYLVRICHNGLWKIVLLDDCFPCTDRKHLAFTQVR
jgi:calpain-15